MPESSSSSHPSSEWSRSSSSLSLCVSRGASAERSGWCEVLVVVGVGREVEGRVRVASEKADENTARRARGLVSPCV